MAENLLPDTLTRVTPTALYYALRDAWRTMVGQEPVRQSLVLLVAHWALETGRGAACHCFNLGNVKHVRGDGRDYCMFRCSEIIGGKEVWFNPPDPACWFRAFGSLADGATDYLATLKREFPGAWAGVLSGDPSSFAHLLKVGHYYTASETLYAAAMVRWFDELDREIGPDTLPDVAQAALEEAGLELIVPGDDDEPPDAGS